MADERKRRPGQGGAATNGKSNHSTHARIGLISHEPTESEINEHLADNPPLDPWREYIEDLGTGNAALS
jgi:hypothetical protein